jgi:hypothetical protein
MEISNNCNPGEQKNFLTFFVARRKLDAENANDAIGAAKMAKIAPRPPKAKLPPN